MATIGALTWDAVGQHYYSTGIDGVALYVWDTDKDPGTAATPRGWFGAPVAWSGVTAVNESPSGAESNKQYADNIEYLNLISKEEFGATIECFQTPEEFDECDGCASLSIGGLKLHAQTRKNFGLVYRVQKGSDTVEAGKLGYVYHIIYGCKAAPSSRDNATVNESPEAQTLSYELSTSPITNAAKEGSGTIDASTGIFGAFYTDNVQEIVHVEVDDTDLTSDQKNYLKALLYNGSFKPSSTELAEKDRMPTPGEILAACSYS